MEKSDITIIGAGVIGLAASYELSSLGKDILTIEKHDSFGQETSSRNSEVIHAGLYYPKNSLKAKTCIRGRELLYDFCSKNNIPHKKLGKLVVAYDKEGDAKLDDIYKNASECGVENLKFLDKNEIKKLEPNISANKGMFSPDTGILDSHKFMNCLFQKAKSKNVNFAFSVEIIGIKKKASLYEVLVREPNGDTFTFTTKVLINCAGLFASNIAELAGIDIDRHSYRAHYCKGDYFRIKNPKKFSIRHLIYPPPSSTDLGIHLTPDLAGGLRLGPDVEYVEALDYNVDEGKKDKFCKSALNYLPSLSENDLMLDTSGIRPKLQKENEDFRDFIIHDEKEKNIPNFINLIGIESPGLTGSLAIAEILKNIVAKY